MKKLTFMAETAEGPKGFAVEIPASLSGVSMVEIGRNFCDAIRCELLRMKERPEFTITFQGITAEEFAAFGAGPNPARFEPLSTKGAQA